MTQPPPSRARWAGLSLATLGATAAGLLLASPDLLQAWRLAITLLLGMAVGSLALVMLGELLSTEWLQVVEDELLPAAWTVPLLALLALPLLALPAPDVAAIIGDELTPARAAWFAPWAMLARLGFAVLLWTALAWLATRRRERRWPAALGLALLAPSFALVASDWVVLMRPFWSSTLLPFALASSQLAAALALAFVANLVQRERASEARFASLSTGLLGLALLVLWVWFVQGLVAWAGNLPNEAGWYLARMGPGGWLLVAAAVAMIAAILLLAAFARRGPLMLGVAALMLAAHLAHAYWLLRPARLDPPSLLDIVVPALLGTLWLAWVRTGQRLFDAHYSGRPGSSYQGRSGGTSGGQTCTSPSV